MNFRFADNVHLQLCDAINSLLPSAQEARIAVAFVKYSGLRLVEPALDKCLERGGHVEFIVGLDFRTTDAQSLRALFKRAASGSQCHLYCYSDPSDYVNAYHPKLYLFDINQTASCIIGSSNLTQGGLKDNVEVNVILEFGKQDDALETIRDIYAQIKYRPSRFAPDVEYIDAYEDTVKEAGSYARRTGNDKGIRKALDFLRQKELSLPKPFVAPDTLGGWQKLVFEKLPPSTFSTSYLYQYAAEFQAVYPDNLHIEPKIRQVLQQLRDLGLVIHLGEGIWVKRTAS